MAKVRKTATCWVWTASVDTKGYGQLGFAGRLIKAHRFSWLLHKGQIPAGHKVRQSCGNRRCVRSTHLYTSEEHQQGNYFTLDGTTRNFLDGLLLGDGCYHSRNPVSATLWIGQRADRIAWLHNIAKFMKARQVSLLFAYRKARVNRLRGKPQIKANAFVLCRTAAYRTLLPEYHRWYPRGKKRVPRDIDLTDPVLLAQWYMGDGNVYVPRNRRGVQELALNTQGFPLVDVRWLAAEFAERLGLRAFVKRASRKRGRQPILALSRHQAERFIELVRPHMCPVFSYKIPKTVARRTRGKLLKHGRLQQSIAAWAKQTGLHASVIRDRLKHGWTISQTLTLPTLRPTQRLSHVWKDNA